MTKNAALIIVVALGSAATASIALSQPVAPYPAYKAEDHWLFREHVSPGDKERNWSRTIIDVDSNNQIQVRLGNGSVEKYDAAMNHLPQGREDRRRILAKYPMKVGDEWSFSVASDNPNWAETGSSRVESFEQIVVPAGTFQCFKVNSHSTRGWRYSGVYTTWSRWYCPEIKWFAKEERMEQSRDSGNPANVGTRYIKLELVRFVPGK